MLAPVCCMHMHSYIYIYEHTQAHTHTHTHTHTRARTHSHTHAYSHTYPPPPPTFILTSSSELCVNQLPGSQSTLLGSARSTVTQTHHASFQLTVFSSSYLFVCLFSQQEEVADRYLVCTKHYQTIRDGLAQLKLTSDAEAMTKILQVCPNCLSVSKFCRFVPSACQFLNSAGLSQVPVSF